MREISAAIPVTPVPLVATLFRAHDLMSEEEILAGIAKLRVQWHERVWLLREKTPAEIWRAARHVLELRRLVEPAQRWRSDLFDGSGVPVIEDVWRWNPAELLLRDYYANSLVPFDDVKSRGWPERKLRITQEAVDASASAHVSTA
jgi:hypothetical protein